MKRFIPKFISILCANRPQQHLFVLLPLLMLFAACQPSLPEAKPLDERPVLFPDYMGVTVPCNIAPLNFRLEGTHPTIARLMAGKEELRIAASDGSLSIPQSSWERRLQAAKGDQLQVEL